MGFSGKGFSQTPGPRGLKPPFEKDRKRPLGEGGEAADPGVNTGSNTLRARPLKRRTCLAYLPMGEEERNASSKIQDTNKFQISSSKSQTGSRLRITNFLKRLLGSELIPLRCQEFPADRGTDLRRIASLCRAWCLRFVWSLVLEIWNLFVSCILRF